MTPYVLIMFGLWVLWITWGDMKDEESDVLFWFPEFFFGRVTKMEHPKLYRFGIGLQFFTGIVMFLIGLAWLVFVE